MNRECVFKRRSQCGTRRGGYFDAEIRQWLGCQGDAAEGGVRGGRREHVRKSAERAAVSGGIDDFHQLAAARAAGSPTGGIQCDRVFHHRGGETAVVIGIRADCATEIPKPFGE